MNEEKYVVWHPTDRQPGQMIVEKVLDNDEGLFITLRYQQSADKPLVNDKLEILFDAFAAYRNIDESYRARTIDKYPAGIKNTFYTVTNSSWIKWLDEESKGIYTDCDIKHYSIITISDWVDVLSEFPPEFRWINDN